MLDCEKTTRTNYHHTHTTMKETNSLYNTAKKTHSCWVGQFCLLLTFFFCEYINCCFCRCRKNQTYKTIRKIRHFVVSLLFLGFLHIFTLVGIRHLIPNVIGITGNGEREPITSSTSSSNLKTYS